MISISAAQTAWALAVSDKVHKLGFHTQRVYVLITTLYFSDTVFLNVVLVRYIYTWGWLVPTLFNGVVSTMKVI